MAQAVTTGQAAKMCGVTPDAVLKWIKSGKIKAFRTPGGHYRIRKEHLMDFIVEENQALRETNAAPTDTRVSFCWEYHSDNGDIKEECRNCTVYKARAERCYLIAGLGDKAGHEGAFCLQSCDQCQFYRFVNVTKPNILIITENDDLRQRILSDKCDEMRVKFSGGKRETEEIIEEYRLDYIVIDDTLRSWDREEITYFLSNNSLVRGAPVIIAADKDEARRIHHEGYCATIHVPFNCKDLETCINRLNIQLLGESGTKTDK